MKTQSKSGNQLRKSSRVYKSSRSHAGNILVISSVSFTMVCLAIIVGYSFAGLFFVNNRLQTSADEIALAGAKKLNDRDRIGQMNNMVARCRQLVFSSRQDFEQTKRDFPHLENFAEPLLTDARDSAVQLETERQKISSLAESESKAAMRQRFDEIKTTYAMTLPWLKIAEPRLTDLRVGRVEDVETNVEQLKHFTDLDKNDETNGFVLNLPPPALRLYRSELPDGMRLPGDDNDLVFKLSSLPAPVDRIIAPARVMLPNSLKPATAGSAPSAARVSLQLNVESGLGFSSGGVLHSTGAASTTGACIQQ